ncbi:LytR/AlgR family response regulator transcription factor [Maribacter ulvicola]|uniref:Two component transcriptional regulator, LytTR family n=1 Tax=Maribacter ulvicola TaxID=228959 RepID=A0A1N6QYV9_9FLAO|nr:LytTR family DNA-binding domain-containing protein [Maribacter ulvicola]SIQ21804.1 two component transcriptional regulator, LytTR family [Maribacter ulvicola]
MIKCIIVEDQPPAQRVLKKYIDDVKNLELKAIFADAISAIDYLKEEKIDLIFLDIHLPKISGIEFLKVLKNKPAVILTTAFSDYALESYEYDVVDYLLKPFSFKRFVQAVHKLPNPNEVLEHNFEVAVHDVLANVIFIKCGYEHIKIEVGDIRFIQSDADYTELYTKDRKYLSHETLKYWQEFLDSQLFLRIHRSYILNICKIHKIIGNQVLLESGESLPIGRAYKEDFMNKVIK